MHRITVSSIDYSRELAPLFKQRALENGLEGLTERGGAIELELNGKELPALSRALAELLLIDLKPFELARLIENLPVPLRDRRRILPAAAELARDEHLIEPAARDIEAFLGVNSLFVPEGFLRFRLQYVLEEWARAADEAGERLTASGPDPLPFSRTEVKLFPDGSCVISDEIGHSIECEWEDFRALSALLSALAPHFVTLFDLTRGAGALICAELFMLFAPRAALFVLR